VREGEIVADASARTLRPVTGDRLERRSHDAIMGRPRAFAQAVLGLRVPQGDKIALKNFQRGS
jgi:hypothetical protein